jgi:SAM-dependent methyltransferase
METKTHWEHIYGTRPPDRVSWFAPHLRTSLAYIKQTGLPATAQVVDVGGGESTLVDDLLDAGYRNLSVLDISGNALEVCRDRLGARAGAVQWLEADVLQFRFPRQSVDIWHDRAVFHFLNDAAQRRQYVDGVLHALRPGGFAVVATFGPEGPTRCSGLPVSRYGADGLHAEFGKPFELLDSTVEIHTTPWGAPQQFVYCLCRLPVSADRCQGPSAATNDVGQHPLSQENLK